MLSILQVKLVSLSRRFEKAAVAIKLCGNSNSVLDCSVNNAELLSSKAMCTQRQRLIASSTATSLIITTCKMWGVISRLAMSVTWLWVATGHLSAFAAALLPYILPGIMFPTL